MKEFTFTVRETLTTTAYIEAETLEEARAKLKEQYEAGHISVDDMEDVEFVYKSSVELVDPRDMTFERFEIFGVPALFTEMRANNIIGVPGLDRLHRYDLRHGDDDGIPITVERRVLVNRYGTIFTAVPLLAVDETCKAISDDDWGFDSDLDDCTPMAFLAELSADKEQ